jgi:polyribonucleotide nucleotidyltransferase
VEVDRERGRIGLRLAEDPEIQGKNKEELSAIAAAEATRSRPDRGSRDRDRGPRNGDRGGSRDRDGGRDRDRGRVRDRDPDRPRS